VRPAAHDEPRPLPSEFGAYKTVKARLWLCLKFEAGGRGVRPGVKSKPESVLDCLMCSKFARQRSLTPEVQVAEECDLVHMMSYDQPGRHSPTPLLEGLVTCTPLQPQVTGGCQVDTPNKSFPAIQKLTRWVRGTNPSTFSEAHDELRPAWQALHPSSGCGVCGVRCRVKGVGCRV